LFAKVAEVKGNDMHNSAGLDLDGILYDYYGLMKQYFKSLPEECATLDTMDVLSLDDRQKYYQFSRSPYMIKELTMYDGALDFISWLQPQFKSLYIITSRHISTEGATKKQIKTWGIPITNIVFEKEKQKVVPDMVSIFFEDSPRHLDNLKKFKYLKLLVPRKKYNEHWINANLGDYSVYPYSSFEEAKIWIEHLLKENTNA
jgi:hypothetical protein